MRQHLAPSARADTPRDVARDLVALHATDPASVYLSIYARKTQASIAQIEAALYADRVLVRMLGMRRTMFVVDRDLAPIVQSACTQAIAVQLRRRYAQLLGSGGISDDADALLRRVEEQAATALRERGEATAQELGNDVPELRTQITLAVGKNYEGTQSIATWVLMLLSADGRIVRGRPRGSWISSQYRWAPIDAWFPSGLTTLPAAEAQVALVREWLRAFGPGTLDDLKWWTGLTLGEIRRAVQQVDVAEVNLGESTGLMLADDLEPILDPEPWVALLPALDPTPMGYTQRDWFLGPHAARIFDRSGNIGPSVWCDGRIVGGWAQRANGAIAYKLLEDVGRDAEREVRHAAAALADWLGSVRITPRFRTPLERELSGS